MSNFEWSFLYYFSSPPLAFLIMLKMHKKDLQFLKNGLYYLSMIWGSSLIDAKASKKILNIWFAQCIKCK